MRHVATPDGTSAPVPRLGDLDLALAGYVQMVRCGACQHLAPLPLAMLIQRFGKDAASASALRTVVCSACRVRGRAETRLLRLCDPGCGRNRG